MSYTNMYVVFCSVLIQGDKSNQLRLEACEERQIESIEDVAECQAEKGLTEITR